ncbi:UvrD-helicase domain-containing protein [Ralstonia pseudosolanacearum]|uniref:UvrD-helicase domain-containing protein n=1 Tax=Ralstonia pseudosolanacearum TaxID=1310165 RepID=UPI00270B04E6|nr:UvrD-helicase domain-containing protein [Ralstonia pseudosolanacearum]MDO3617952.1 UvrD-helicase domain-containing protein [Ralstonia pseudosolanacearum]
MPPPEIDIFQARLGSVTAPAGCGKTQLIADALSQHAGNKPVLVLTHTNAGVAALRGRLQRGGVPSSAYRVSTIDGFAMRIAGKFPLRAGLDARVLELANPNADYPAIRGAVQEGHISDPIASTYSRLLVDEYQDCNTAQHAIACSVAQILPTCILGDPMQAIFGFRDPLVHWEREAQVAFPPIGALRTPWRWRLAGMDALGAWLLQARASLQAGQPVDLRGVPEGVQWVQLTQGMEVQQRLMAARIEAPTRDGHVLVIGDSMNAHGRHQLTMQTPGATSVEAVDLRDLVNFARQFDLASPNALRQLAEFAASMMTGVGPTNLLARVETIRGGRARTPATAAEAAGAAFMVAPSYTTSIELLQALADQHGARVYRPEVLHCCISALRSAGDEGGLIGAAMRVRERNRHMGRPLGRRSVGSTLLLKGLEADVAVILEPERMTAQHLYVALTRGARRVVVCSSTPLLTPAMGRGCVKTPRWSPILSQAF